MNTVLLVEDDTKIANEIVSNLEGHNFLVTHVRTVAQTVAIDLQQFSLLILDWNLPDGEGIEIVKRLRSKNIETPVLMLTARTGLDDRRLATDMGVTDFLGKPFYFHELLARVSMVIDMGAGKKKGKNEIVENSGIQINIFERQVLFDEKSIVLTKKEFDLLLFFVRNPKIVFSRDEILDAVWGRGEAPTNRTVDTHVLQLRKKFSAGLFETVWSSGYRFLPNES